MPTDQVAKRLLSLARQDPAITGAAFTGSHATGHTDEWSDLDLVLAIHGDRTPVVAAWRVASAHAKGAHLVELGLEPTLVRYLDVEELLRALGAAAGVLAAEVGHWDAGLAGRLGPGLEELAAR